MRRGLVALALLAAFLVGGCTHTSITQIDSPFPPTAKTMVKCVKYGSMQDATVDRRKQAHMGWLPTMVGHHDHHYFAFVWIALTSTLEICYEKEAGASSKEPLPEREIRVPSSVETTSAKPDPSAGDWAETETEPASGD